MLLNFAAQVVRLIYRWYVVDLQPLSLRCYDEIRRGISTKYIAKHRSLTSIIETLGLTDQYFFFFALVR